MLIAYNNDIEFRSRWYHIQTEDNGIKDGHITTTVFFSGQILDSKTTSYLDAIAGITDVEEQNRIIKNAMTTQHKLYYTKLYEGTYEAQVNAAHKTGNSSSGLNAVQGASKAAPLLPPSGVQPGGIVPPQSGAAINSSSVLPSNSRLGKPDILRASQQVPGLSSAKGLGGLASIGGITKPTVQPTSAMTSRPNPPRQSVLKHSIEKSAAVIASGQNSAGAFRGVKWPETDLSIDVLVMRLLSGEEV